VAQAGRVIPDYDIHLHTWLSPCGAKDESLSSVAAYAATAKEFGLTTIGISDHFALENAWTPTWLLNSGPAIIHEARRLAAQVVGMRVLVGCEADLIKPGVVTIDAEFARKVDFVLLSPTHFDQKEIAKEAGATPKTAAEYMVRFTEAAVQLPFVDVMAHPFAVPEERLGSPEAYMQHVDDAAIARISCLAAANSIAFELNGRIAAMPLYRSVMRRFFHIAKSEGVKFTIGSDSHQITSMIRLAAIEVYARELELVRGDFLTVNEIAERHKGR